MHAGVKGSVFVNGQIAGNNEKKLPRGQSYMARFSYCCGILFLIPFCVLRCLDLDMIYVNMDQIH